MTRLFIAPDLLDLALALSGERTKKAGLHQGAQGLHRATAAKRLLDPMGKLEWDEGFDDKAERPRLCPAGRRRHRLAS
ncbi:MAG: type II toxin-antitoxin system VapB family antitoxin [Alphaproteobacteria bacterium]|nr:type II toxin-antitoxin system VapB family antitoxin [Alphaproteobacteria bacterium]